MFLHVKRHELFEDPTTSAIGVEPHDQHAA
jgi:hypothetical protein